MPEGLTPAEEISKFEQLASHPVSSCYYNYHTLVVMSNRTLFQLHAYEQDVSIFMLFGQLGMCSGVVY